MVFYAFVITRSLTESVLLAGQAYAILYLAMVLHELGHLAMAKALGLDVPMFSIGGGIRAMRARLGNTTVLIGPFAVEGYITINGHSVDLFKAQQSLVTAAGPVTNLLVAAVAFAHHMTIGFDVSTTLVTLFIALNVMVGAINLVPMKARGPFGEIPSDGLQLWHLRCMPEAEIAQAMAASQLMHAFAEYQGGSPDTVLELLDQIPESGEVSNVARTLVTVCLAESGRLDEGIVAARELLDLADLEPYVEATAENNLAYVLLLSRDPDVLEEAEQLARSAFQQLPMSLAVISTLGSVLVARGLYEEGLRLLSDRRFAMETRSHQASVLAARSLAERALGNPRRAMLSLSKAMRFDPTHPLVAAAAASADSLPLTSR